MSEGLSAQIHDTYYLNGLKSDHSALFVGLDMHPQERGPSYWKFNTSLLQSQEFLEEMNNFLNKKIIQLGNLDPDKKWENLKDSIHTKCMEYCKNRSNEVKKKLVIYLLSSPPWKTI